MDEETTEQQQGQQQRTLYLLTNNSTKSRREYKKKFIQMGFETFDGVIEDVFCSAYAAALYLKERVKSIEWDASIEEDTRQRGIFVVGMNGIQEELANVGLHSFGYEFSDRKTYSEDDVLRTFAEYKKKYDIKCVVVGYDKHWNMFKLAFATLCLREIPGCIYVATNEDRNLPWKNSLLPGNGTIIESINVSTERKPEIVCGKPNTLLLDHIVDQHNLDKSSILMVGDRLETDIRMANQAGILSMAVLSGAASGDDIANAEELDRPHFVISGLDEVYEILTESNQEEDTDNVFRKCGFFHVFYINAISSLTLHLLDSEQVIWQRRHVVTDVAPLKRSPIHAEHEVFSEALVVQQWKSWMRPTIDLYSCAVYQLTF
eukprot:CAMPEP_0117444830 /NCGR_PEP_ID=MMETSP0759-20121206/5461_1 /TAXON_ID=63605 /ORGANISM="Percolomonas cosmopolitus, Strain WS" /LENGTH=374 /DNA_ID=CAMNT_0005236945 /DNA_START=126 /DNA_END=1251 /DNA_ORIENTATION=-